MNAERVTYWLERGAKPTDRVAVFLGKAEILPMPPRTKGIAKQKAREAEAAAGGDSEGNAS